MRHHFGKVDYLQLLVILIVFISAILVNNNTTTQILGTHFTTGQPDMYASKFYVLFLLPIMMLFFYLLFLLIPYMSYGKEIDEFYDNYGGFRLAMILFLAIIYYSLLLSNFNFVLNMNYVIIPSFAAVFFYFGHLISVAKRKHVIGFKNYWTKDSDFVWEKTHKFSGFLFKSFAVISLISLILPQYFIYFFIIPLIIIIVTVLLYSKYVHKHYILALKQKDEDVARLKEERLKEEDEKKKLQEIASKKSIKKAKKVVKKTNSKKKNK